VTRPAWNRRLRRYFIIGVIVLVPAGITAVVLAWLFRTLDAILGRTLELVIGAPVPGLGLALLVVTILATGWIAHYTIGRRLIAWWNALLARFPLTARIYNGASQIVQTLMGQQRNVFQRTVLVEFPHEHSYAIAWVTAEANAFAEEVLGEPCVNVFVATTPNPTSGFFLVVPKRRTIPVNLSVEEAMKLVISAGAVMPQAGEGPGRGLDLAALLQRPGS